MNQHASYLKLLALCAVSALAVAGCLFPRYYSEPGDNVYLMADYQDALNLWMAHDELHHNLIGVADLNAIYRSWEVRQAFIQAVKNRWNPDQELIDRAIERELNNHRQGHEFYLGLYCYHEEWNRLTGINPLWHVSLVSDTGGPVAPIKIEKLEVQPDESWFFLRELTHGRQIYRVFFPLVDESDKPLITRSTRKFQLMCDALIGDLTVTWRLGPVPETLQ